MANLSDDFTRADNPSLGASWTEAVDGSQIVSNACAFTGSDTVNVHVTALSGVHQYGKMGWSGGTAGDVHQPYFVFRYTDSSSPYYTVRFDVDGDTVSWRRHTSTADLTGTVIASTAQAVGLSDTWGVTLAFTGTSTVVRCWLNPTGLPTTDANWNGDTTPEVTFTTDPATAVDTGTLIGFGQNTANPFAQSADNWFGGDVTVGPIISAHPSDQSVYLGQSASFSVTASGTGVLHYQWKDDGANVGTDSSSYNPTPAYSDSGSSIMCVVSDDNGSSDSNAAILTVFLTAKILWLRA